jgi:hypothetical protein
MAKTPDEILDLEIAVHGFCIRPQDRLLKDPTEFPVFRAGPIGQLRFHQIAMPSPALEVEVQLFAAALHDWLTVQNGYALTVDAHTARAAVRAQVALKDELVPTLLAIIDAHYQ